MATTYRVLGQAKNTSTSSSILAKLYHANPLADSTEGTLAATTVQTIISTITVCNTSGVPQYYDIAIYKANSTVSTPDTFTAPTSDNYVVKSGFLNAYETVSLTLGITLDTHDRIGVFASGAASSQYVNFFAFGSETRG